MRVFIIPEKGPKRNLLEAARNLVAENGFDLVSVRDIAAAVNANIAAVNYHFGSRQNLIHLIISEILQPLIDQRLSSLDHAERQHPSKKIPSGEIIHLSVASIASTLEPSGIEQSLYYRLAGRILNLPDSQLPEDLAAARKNVRSRYLKALSRALPELPALDLALRFSLFDEGLAHNLTHAKPLAEPTAILENAIQSGQLLLGGTIPPSQPDDDNQPFLFDL